MAIRLLGQVGLMVNGGFVSVGGSRPSCVLAVLALSNGQPVSVDAAVDRVWGDDAPPAARGTLYAYVSRLRRLLAGQDGVSLRRVGPGYVLEAAAELVDVHHMRELTARARQAPPDAALGLWREASALWPTGQPLGGVTGQWGEAVREALSRERVDLLVQLYTAELAAGRHAEVAGDLSQLMVEYPLAEPLAAQLVTALHRCGRTAEALEAFEQTRSRLRSELGSHPGAVLQAAHRLVLTAPAAKPQGAVLPRQLPARVELFVGRRQELAALDAWAAGNGSGPLIVSGMAGAGKSSLATAWAARSEWPDGQLYVDLQGWGPGRPLRPLEALGQLLGALGVPPARIPAVEQEAAGLFRSLVAGKRLLLVLDNAREAEQVRPALPSDGGTRVVVTSRERLPGLIAREGACELLLQPLTEPEAAELVACLVGQDRAAAEPEAAAALAQVCGRLPLAIRIATIAVPRHHGTTPIARTVARLAGDSALTRLTVRGDAQASLRTVFSYSYLAHSADVRATFRALGLLPVREFTTELVAALTQNQVPDAQEHLWDLADSHLVIEAADGRYTLHDLLRTYARDLTEDQDTLTARAAALWRAHDWYLHRADAAARLLFPQFVRLPVDPHPARFNTPDQARTWLVTEEENLTAIATQAADHGLPRTAWQLGDTLRPYFAAQRALVRWLTVAEAAQAAAASAGDDWARTSAAAGLGFLHHCRGDYRRAIAYGRRTIRHGERAGWAEAVASATDKVGIACSIQGWTAHAITHMERALAINTSLGRTTGRAIGLNNLGADLLRTGELDDAEARLAEALALSRAAGTTRTEAATLINLGAVHHRRGRFEQARTCLRDAIDLDTRVGHRDGETAALTNLAWVELDDTHPEQALRHARTAAAMARRSADPYAQSRALLVLGATRLRLGGLLVAQAVFGKALALAEESHVRHPLVAALIGLAETDRRRNRAAPARERAAHALQLARESGYRPLEGFALQVLAAQHLADGEVQPAGALAAEALTLHRATAHPFHIARAEALLRKIRSTA
ncbi:BTAD domain-containing putative transcriptional regulator [Kitasatospora sp. NPDC002040]|uniref:AfsR/SARP family transcriptional regulator n=1 Tax=Kitasatospora sp. NPDC002040 TaxID=3154661 RepID=UPI00331BF861